MKILFEEHAAAQRAGGVEAATAGLVAALVGQGMTVMGERGRAVVAERFAWEGIAGQFVECYRWILGEGERPDCVRQ